MRVIVAFELKDSYIERMVEQYKNSDKSDRDLSTPLGFFAYALTGGLIDFGMDSDDVEVIAYAVPDNPAIFEEDRNDPKIKVLPPKKFERIWNAL